MCKFNYATDMALNADTKIQFQALTKSLGINEDAAYASIGLTQIDIESDVADARVSALLTVCDSVRPWFDSPAALWSWFTSQPLIGFGGKTPAGIIRDYDGQGGDALMQFIESKQLGGFE